MKTRLFRRIWASHIWVQPTCGQRVEGPRSGGLGLGFTCIERAHRVMRLPSSLGLDRISLYISLKVASWDGHVDSGVSEG